MSTNRKQRRHPTHPAVLPIQPSSEKVVTPKTEKADSKGLQKKPKKK